MPRSVESQERREQILRAAVSVFSARGYSQATISDIAAAAGLAHGTIYLYFRSKAVIFETLVGWFVQTLLESIAEPDSVPSSGAPAPNRQQAADLASEMYRMFYSALSACEAHPRLAEVSLRMAHNATPEVAPAFSRFQTELIGRLRRRLGQAVDAGAIRPIDTDEAAQIIVQLLGTAIESLLAQESAGAPARIARSTVDFILYGLAGESSRNNSGHSSVSVSEALQGEQPVGSPPSIRSSCESRGATTDLPSSGE